jgi:ABC-2 type transport system ATP-binding protein
VNAIEYRDTWLEYVVSKDGAITSIKEWAIQRLRQKPVYRRLVALREVSLNVAGGRAVGVVGSNGAGKSTLLRLAAGILQPSQGSVTTRGRVAPIIELGTGFEFELSGRENIFFNGALLGRSWAEMNDRVEEIIAFAELGDFIDNPIRTYSTGMVARLAFSIATTVEADILLLDEVLSVGDQRFREKCTRRMDAFRDAGVTILYVSHDSDAVARVCDDAVWLKEGRLEAFGPASDVVRQYTDWVARVNGHGS